MYNYAHFRLYRRFLFWTGIALVINIVYAGGLHGQQVLLDEDFSEWTESTLVYQDPAGDAPAGSVDFGQLHLASDGRYLYLLIEVGKEINFQSNNDLVFYLDIDNNQATGFPTRGIGADIRYFPGLRLGFGSLSGFEFEIRHPDIGLISSPTVTGTRFELLLSRTLEINGTEVEMGDQVRIAWSDDLPGGDQLPDLPGGVLYEMQDGGISLPGASFVKSAEQDLRVISWNVLQDGIFQPGRTASFERILKAVQPDVIGFQEIYDHPVSQVRNFVANALPESEWFADQMGLDIFIVSKYPVKQSRSLFGNGAFLLDLGERDLLVVNAHLPCCDNDLDRQDEADQIMGFIRDVKDGVGSFQVEAGTPVVILGDMNLVGLRTQQQTLITGDIQNEILFGPDVSPDWDDSILEDALPFATGLPAGVTWIQPFSSFSPGRLDYILYTGSVMELKHTFGVNTAGMTQDELDMYGLFAFDSFNASDHLLLAADFSFDLNTNTANVAGREKSVHVFPNPADDLLYLQSAAGLQEMKHVRVVDRNGRTYTRKVEREAFQGATTGYIRVSGLPPGFYFVVLGDEVVRFVKA